MRNLQIALLILLSLTVIGCTAATATPDAPPTDTPHPTTILESTATPSPLPATATIRATNTLTQTPYPSRTPEPTETPYPPGFTPSPTPTLLYTPPAVANMPAPDFDALPAPGQQVAQRTDLIEPYLDVETMSYLLYLPEAYDSQPDRQWPMIVFLHGDGHQGDNPELVRVWGLPKEVELMEGGLEFIILSPQVPLVDVAWDPFFDDIAQLMQDISADYRVDPTRLYLTGLSMGGYGTWEMVLAYPELFAAAASVSGSGVRLDFGEPFPVRTFCNITKTPLWAVHGVLDNVSLWHENYEAVNSLTACRGDAPVFWTLYEDTNHFSTVTRIYNDAALYEWFLSYTREE